MKPAKTTKKTVKESISTEQAIKDIGTDIGDGPQEINITQEQESPTWLVNLLTIMCHSVSLTEQAINGKLVGEIGTQLDSKRTITILIEDIK